MDGTIGEIRMFAGNFAPRNWLFCEGAELAITQYSELYSIIGTTYGGNGIQTFNLPDFAARTPIGTGNNPSGLQPVMRGQKVGAQEVYIQTSQMPAHTHAAIVSEVSGSVTINGYDQTLGSGADSPSPNGTVLSDGGTNLYSSKAPNVTLNAAAASLQVNTPTVTNANTGGNQALPIQSPGTGMNYIICYSGLYPQRP